MSSPVSPVAVTGPRALRLVALRALVGVPAALVAALFIAVVHELEHWLWHDLPERLDMSGPPWYLVLGLPLVGACVVLAARALLPGDGGSHRSSSPRSSSARRASTPSPAAALAAVAAWLTMAAIDERSPVRNVTAPRQASG